MVAAQVHPLHTDVDDCALIRAHRSGDPTAFAELYERHHDSLVRMVARRVSEREAIEDIVQETFTAALAALPGLRDPGKFEHWLKGIARHLVVRYYVHRKRVTPVKLLPTHATDAPDTAILRAVDEEQVRAALRRVRARHQLILYLRDTEELSYREIAERLRTPESAVAPLLWRARQSLRREYFALVARDPASGSFVFVAGFGHAMQRLRHRVSRYLTWLPDASTLCNSAACLLVGATALFPFAMADTLHDQVRQPALSSAKSSASLEPSSTDLHRPATDPISANLDGTPPPSDPLVGRGAEVTTDSGTWYRDRDRTRQMPIYIEYGPAFFGADPDAMRRLIASSLEGDFDWLEGSCQYEPEGC